MTTTRSSPPWRAPGKWEYDATTDVASLAAAYAFGFVRNHPYTDGSNRIGFMTLVTFLGINSRDLDTTDEDLVATMLALADGRLTETPLASWVRTHLQGRK